MFFFTVFDGRSVFVPTWARGGLVFFLSVVKWFCTYRLADCPVLPGTLDFWSLFSFLVEFWPSRERYLDECYGKGAFRGNLLLARYALLPRVPLLSLSLTAEKRETLSLSFIFLVWPRCWVWINLWLGFKLDREGYEFSLPRLFCDVPLIELSRWALSYD